MYWRKSGNVVTYLFTIYTMWFLFFYCRSQKSKPGRINVFIWVKSKTIIVNIWMSITLWLKSRNQNSDKCYSGTFSLFWVVLCVNTRPLPLGLYVARSSGRHLKRISLQCSERCLTWAARVSVSVATGEHRCPGRGFGFPETPSDTRRRAR